MELRQRKVLLSTTISPLIKLCANLLMKGGHCFQYTALLTLNKVIY